MSVFFSCRNQFLPGCSWTTQIKKRVEILLSIYFGRLGFPSMLEGIDRWLSEGPLPLCLPHVIQFRSLVEFIVSVYGRGWAKCNLAVWTLQGAGKKGRAWRIQEGVCATFWDQFLDFEPVNWGHLSNCVCFNCWYTQQKLNHLNASSFIVRIKFYCKGISWSHSMSPNVI